MILQLLKNGIRYRVLKTLGKPGRPQALSLEVTHSCIARCVMCNIWKIPRSVPDLSLQNWLTLLSSELFTDLVELDITGGEPFLREDLVELISGICDLRTRNLKRLCSLAITTNGLLTDRIIGDTRRILEYFEVEDLTLVVVVAVDAVGELHDRIRGVDGAWNRVDKSIGHLKQLQMRFPNNLVLGIKTTILPLNVDELEGISRYAESQGLFTIISPCIITEARYLNPEKENSMRFDSRQIQKIARFYEKETHGWEYHSRSLVQYYKTGRMRKPCSCGFNYFFIRSNGSVYLCPLIDNPVGSVLETPLEEIFLSKKANRFRRRVGKEPQCLVCTEPGLERYSLPFEGLAYLLLRLRMGRDQFVQMHHHLGLEKYFPD